MISIVLHLIGIDHILPLAGEEESGAVLVVEGNQDRWGHVAHLHLASHSSQISYDEVSQKFNKRQQINYETVHCS